MSNLTDMENHLELVAQWAIGLGLSTGHADNIHDLLNELQWQVLELLDDKVRLNWIEAHPRRIYYLAGIKKWRVHITTVKTRDETSLVNKFYEFDTLREAVNKAMDDE